MANSLRRDSAATFFDDLVSEVFARGARLQPLRQGEALPATVRAKMDVVDKGDRFEILVDLPGVKKDDIQVNIEGAYVSIAAENKAEKQAKEGERLLHSERYVASYARRFELPAEVTQEGADAAYESGVLKLLLPKRTRASTQRLNIR